MTINLKTDLIYSSNKSRNYIRSGMSIPFQINQFGGVKMSTDQQLDEEGILINLMDTSNDNAFFQIGNISSFIFKQNNSDIRQGIINRLIEVFDEFEYQNRMRLIKDSIEIYSYGETVYIQFNYYSIESGETKTIAIKSEF